MLWQWWGTVGGASQIRVGRKAADRFSAENYISSARRGRSIQSRPMCF